MVRIVTAPNAWDRGNKIDVEVTGQMSLELEEAVVTVKTLKSRNTNLRQERSEGMTGPMLISTHDRMLHALLRNWTQ